MKQNKQINLQELARAITTTGWVCPSKTEKLWELSDFVVSAGGMREFVDNWYYSTSENGWVIPDKWFLEHYKK